MRVRVMVIATMVVLGGCASQSYMRVVFEDGNEFFCEPYPGGNIVECDAPDPSQAPVLIAAPSVARKKNDTALPNTDVRKDGTAPWAIFVRAGHGPIPLESAP